MLDPRPPRLPAQPPTIAPPPRFVERRVAYRRAEDQLINEERVFLARALDSLASDAPAEERLAGLLRLFARTVGARRAAVLADGIERRAAVSVVAGEDPTSAEALAAWLDATADRPRAERAAAGSAPVSLIEEAGGVPRAVDPAAGRGVFRLQRLPAAGVVLGFEFASATRASRFAERFPPTLARHAGAALAVVAGQLAAEREAATLRGRDIERNRFVSTAAHELRTPLTGLRGYLELILAGKVDDPVVERDFLARSRTIVESMGELVADLLELSRLESGTLELEIEPFSVAESAGRVAASLLPIAIERDLRLTTELPPRLRSAIGDRRRVEQVLTNLAGNALKFTPAGGTVDLVGRFDGAVAVFVVRDDGIGIEAADRARIFERFERLAGHDGIAGTGLGLPIARDLAQRMGGDLDVASVPGAGSAFVLVLPGPAPVAEAAIAAALDRALGVEEQQLEERAVLRVLAAAPGDTGHAGGVGHRLFPSTSLRHERGRRPSAAVPVDG
jgi:signal transduction histidine kinase